MVLAASLFPIDGLTWASPMFLSMGTVSLWRLREAPDSFIPEGNSVLMTLPSFPIGVYPPPRRRDHPSDTQIRDLVYMGYRR